MFDDAKDMLVMISSYAGARPDYVQGGGGNTSVKFDDTLMGIKASGYTLGEITADQGYVTVDYPAIKAYYETVDTTAADKDFEAESLQVNLDSIRLLPGLESKRPSVEVGFHSFLSRCVIHTHSVYANVLCCSEEGQTLAQKIFEGSGIKYLFVPYVDPGFRLTLTIKKAAEAYAAANGVVPELIFMENHGVIAHADSAEAAIALHESANNAIRQALGIAEFPLPRVQETEQGYVNTTPYMLQVIGALGVDEAYFNTLKIYPDQLVYIGAKMGDSVRLKADGITYRMSEKEARTVDETLLGVVFVMDAIRAAGLTLRQMREQDAAFIGNWESEKYRAKLVKSGGSV
jgi:rhamnose utilization protein RhaD (predicted bifunctional aldolase and dehydrogenase)